MTDSEMAMAIHLAACVFVPGTATKRFARDMAFRAAGSESSKIPLTEKQAKYLREAVIRFRRQIPNEVVELARQAASMDGGNDPHA